MKTRFLIFAILFTSSLFTAQQSLADVVYTENHELDFENCEGILDIEEIKSVINRIDEITVNSRGLTPIDGEPGLQTMCDSTFESQGKSISMIIVVMDSTDTASTMYEKNLDAFSGPDFDIKEYDTFWNNFDVTVNDQNVGSFIISQYDKFFINFNTSFDGDGSPLIDTEELRRLSAIVQKKILDLDDVPISPPNPIPNLDDPDRFTPEHGVPPIETGKLLSPKKQISQGIDPTAVKCNEGLVLIIKNNGSPACVKPDTAENLQQRSWGGIPPPCCKPTDVSLEMEHATSSYMNKIIPTLDDFRNTLSVSQDIDTIFFKFGEPHYDIGSGIHIYVYELNDSTQVWIGYTDKILYVNHVDSDGTILEHLF